MTASANLATADRAPTSLDSPAPPVALYVHIPFCLSVCPYCDFVVYTGAAAKGARSRIEEFVAALRTEIELRADALALRFPVRAPLETLYFGGGTPSLLPAAVIADLIGLIRDRFGLTQGAEITIEANPGPDERGDLAGFRAAGVNRISFGAQSFDPRELRGLGRRHGPSDIADAVRLARSAGFESVNLDLLYDVPGQSRSSWDASLEAALALETDHLSLYALTLDDPESEGLTGPLGDHLPVRRGAARWRAEARRNQDDDRAADQYLSAIERLDGAGWRGYELSNWARPGHECRHNLVYWQRHPYEAVGPGAHAFDGVARRWNAARLDGYVAALRPLDNGSARLPPGGEERLDGRTARAEELILGLRTDRGVLLPDGWAAGDQAWANTVIWATETGLLEAVPDGRHRLTPRGRLLSNEVFARLV